MTKLKMLIELDYDADLMFDEKDAESCNWFLGILRGDDLKLVSSQELGDEVGAVKVLEIIEPSSPKA